MKKNDRINLNSISNIDEKIIDEVTDKKISLMQKLGKNAGKMRKRFIAIGSIAASFLLIVSLLFGVIIPLIGSDVPVYQGMTVRKESASSLKLSDYDLSGNSMDVAFFGDQQDRKKDDHQKPDANKDETEIEDLVTIDVTTDDTVRYYVEPGETFIIEIHIDNPKNYEIQSFTLNGQKYANYMFKEGSTMELLLLEVTAPEEPGYVEYTIDAIKYIDGTEIKDVDMSSGNKSIRVGIVYPKAPSATLTSQSIFATSAEFSIQISDPYSLIGENQLSIYLSDGEQVIDTQPLQVGNNSVSFHNLKADKTYEYGIVTAYDLTDGKGLHEEWLLVQKFTTSKLFSIQNATATPDSISFEVEKLGTPGEITSVSLYDAATDELVATGGPELRSFTNLLSSHTYNLYVDFKYTVGDTEMTDWVAVKGITTPVYYTASFVSNGGSEIPAAKYFVGQDLPVPTREGYTFGGWSQTIDLAQPSFIASEGALEGDTTYYAWWKEETKPLHFNYEGTTEITITGSGESELYIPDYVGGSPVVKIAPSAFRDYRDLKKVVIGNNVTVIGRSAFENCINLETVVLGNSVKTIKEHAFFNCLYLITITIPESVEVIEADAFRDCLHLGEVYNLSNQSLGISVLVEHKSLDAPSLIKRDRSLCFLEIGTKAYLFAGRRANLPSQSPSGYSYEITDFAFYWGEDDDAVRRITEVVIPNGVTKIGASAYMGCPLERVTIAASVKEIGESAFFDTPYLTSVVFENQENWYSGETLIDVSGSYENAINLKNGSKRWYVKE